MSVNESDKFERVKRGFKNPSFVDGWFAGAKFSLKEDLKQVNGALSQKDVPLSDADRKLLEVWGNCLSTFDLAFDTIRVAVLNQIEMRSDLEQVLGILLSSTELTQAETDRRLTRIKEEVSIPREDLDNIAWMRNYIRKASRAEGEGK